MVSIGGYNYNPPSVPARNPLVSGDYNKNWSPFGTGGASAGTWDPVGNFNDKYNPFVTGPRKNAAAAAAGQAQADQIDAANAAQYGPNGPQMADFHSILDPNGTINEHLSVNPGADIGMQSVTAGTATAPTAVTADQLSAQKLNPLQTVSWNADSQAQDAMRSRSLSGENNPWMQMQLQKQGIGETSARDQAAQQALSGAATARSQMAMHGGLSGGAGERAAMNASRDMNAARQSIGRQGQLDRMGLGIANDQTNMGLLGNVAGLDITRGNAALDASKFNSNQALNANQFDVNSALEAGKANQSANLNANQYNTTAGMNTNQFNINKALEAAGMNQTTGLAKDEYNRNMLYDQSKNNVWNAMHGTDALNEYNLKKYGIQMGGYGANMQASAAARGGGGGGGGGGGIFG